MPTPPPRDPYGPVAHLSQAAQAFRAAWVAGARAYLARKTGRPSHYTPTTRLDGGRNARTGKTHHRAVWEELARRVRAAGYDPVFLVACLFSWWPHDEMPEPRDILAEENLERYRDRQRRRVGEIHTAMRAELVVLNLARNRTAAIYADRQQSVYAALVDPGLEVSPLVRYLFAVAYHLPTLITRLQTEALRQYSECPVAYQAALPAELLLPALRTPGPGSGSPL